MSEANGKDPEESKKEEVELPPRLAAIKAFLESLTEEENQRIRSHRPLVKDYAGDTVFVKLDKPEKPFTSLKDVLMHLSIKKMSKMKYNEIWRKNMAKKNS